MGAHADQIFLVFAGRNGVNRGRMSQDFVFTDQCGSSILGDHETGIQAGMFHQERRESTEGIVDQPFQAPFGYIGDF